MAGKRNWYIVRRQLLNAALGCKVRGDPLAQRLFVPETFRLEDKDAIAGRQDAELAIARSEPDRIMILIGERSEEHTSELQSLMRISYAVFCLKNKKTIQD